MRYKTTPISTNPISIPARRRRAVKLSVMMALGIAGVIVWIARDPLVPTTSDATEVTLAKERATTTIEPTPSASDPNAPLSNEENAARARVLSRFAAGDFETAAALAEAELAKRPNDGPFLRWLKAQYPIILVSAGWTRLRLGDCESAIPKFTRAHGLSPSKESTKGLAYCHYRLKNIALADEWSTIHLSTNPDDTEIWRLRADLLESDERYDEAIDALEHVTNSTQSPAAERAAAGKNLAALRARARESARQDRVTSPNFTLTHRVDLDADTARSILSALESALDEFANELALRPPTNPIEVVIYPASNFHSMLADGPGWAGGIYDGRMRLTADATGKSAPRPDSPAFTRVARHELVHALLSAMSPETSIPTWFHEGLAQRMECPKRCQPTFPFPSPRGAFLPTSSFLGRFTGLSAEDARVAYRQSYFLLWTIEDSFGGMSALREIARAIQPGRRVTPETLLEPIQTSWQALYGIAAERWEGARH